MLNSLCQITGMFPISWPDSDRHRMWGCEGAEYLDVDVSKNGDRNKGRDQGRGSKVKLTREREGQNTAGRGESGTKVSWILYT